MESENFLASHLAWCGLVGLHFARRDGIVNSPAQENMFLIRWLATAERRRLFRKELATDIRWLLKEGREKGLRADLPGKLEYLWRASTGDLSEQNDLYRLQHACSAVSLGGWIYRVLSDTEWDGRNKLRLSASASGLYLNKRSLDSGFDERGCQVAPLEVRITGDLTAFDVLLSRSGWYRTQIEEDEFTHHLHAQSNNGGRQN